MNLSEHFTLEEATTSSTATRAGIDNAPDSEQLAHMKIAAAGMELVRPVLGNNPIHVDSWLRVEALEKILTAKDYPNWCAKHGYEVGHDSWLIYFPKKAHPQGYAVDFICPQFGTPDQIVKAIAASGIKYDQVICEGQTAQGGGWVHISFAPEMRQSTMVATFANGIPTYSYV